MHKVEGLRTQPHSFLAACTHQCQWQLHWGRQLSVSPLGAGLNVFHCFSGIEHEAKCFALTHAPVQTLPIVDYCDPYTRSIRRPFTALRHSGYGFTCRHPKCHKWVLVPALLLPSLAQTWVLLRHPSKNVARSARAIHGRVQALKMRFPVVGSSHEGRATPQWPVDTHIA